MSVHVELMRAHVHLLMWPSVARHADELEEARAAFAAVHGEEAADAFLLLIDQDPKEHVDTLLDVALAVSS